MRPGADPARTQPTAPGAAGRGRDGGAIWSDRSGHRYNEDLGDGSRARVDGVPTADHGFALFGPDAGVPEGGFCASVFLVLRRGDRLLAGSMAPSDRWVREWQPNVVLYEGARREALFEGWRLPATYLREGEHPEAAAGRVWTDQLGLEADPDLPEPRIASEAAPSRSTPDARHWDLVFAYELEGPPLPEEAPAHWAELAYEDPARLREEGFVMLHGELLPLLR